MADTIIFDGIELPIDMEWVDERKYSAVSQTLKRTVANTLVIVEQALIAGRPITLVASEASGWIDKDTVDALYARYTIPYGQYVFNYRDIFTATVAFRHSDPPAIDVEYIVGGKSPNDWFLGQLKFITTEA